MTGRHLQGRLGEPSMKKVKHTELEVDTLDIGSYNQIMTHSCKATNEGDTAEIQQSCSLEMQIEYV